MLEWEDPGPGQRRIDAFALEPSRSENGAGSRGGKLGKEDVADGGGEETIRTMTTFLAMSGGGGWGLEGGGTRPCHVLISLFPFSLLGVESSSSIREDSDMDFKYRFDSRLIDLGSKSIIWVANLQLSFLSIVEVPNL